MARIYKIVNLLNDKVYVGKTMHSLEKRFKEHANDSKRERTSKRPLYAAISKYGIENFSIELLEEVHDNSCSDREIFWILYLDTYRNGYNATKGGDGKPYIDRQDVIDAYASTGSIVSVQKKMNCSYTTISNILRDNSVEVNSLKRATKAVKVVSQEQDVAFKSLTEAAKYIVSLGLSKSSPQKITSKISLVCRGLRHSAYGFKFEYIE